MAFRSDDSYNLSLKGNSLQPSGNTSSRAASARNHSNSKQPITPSRTGYFERKKNYLYKN